MLGKVIKFGTEVRNQIKNGVDKLSNAVGVTLGPLGRVVCIKEAWGGVRITKDGVTVAKSIDFSNQFENIGAQLIKSTAQSVVDIAGDGTTTACVLAQAIYNKGLYLLAAGYNPIDIKRGIDNAVKIVVEKLNEMRKNTQDPDDIAQIGAISSNDPAIGKLLADAMVKVGKDGVITIDESSSMETHLEFSEGMEFDKGYQSVWFVTNAEKNTVDLNNCYILLHEDRLDDVKILVPLLEEVSKQGRSLLIIAEDFGQNFVATLVVNKRNGSLFSCPVRSPGYGERRKEIMKDLSILTGATLFTKDLGNDVSKCEISNLGSATKVVVTRGTTTIIGGAGLKEDIIARVDQIKNDIERYDNPYEKKTGKERLAKLVGGVAVIKVGAPTEIEAKEVKDRVEDAMHATRAAVLEGIVPGGGIALIRCIKPLKEIEKDIRNAGEKAGFNVIIEALQEPLRLIVKNAGGMPDVILSKVLENENVNFGYNAATGNYEDLIETGIIDPTLVVRSAIQNAASTAGILLITEAAVVDEIIEKEEKE